MSSELHDPIKEMVDVAVNRARGLSRVYEINEIELTIPIDQQGMITGHQPATLMKLTIPIKKPSGKKSAADKTE